MNKLHRTMSLLLAFALSLSLMLPVNAAAGITASSVTAKAGESASVDVSMQGNPGFALLKVEVSFDQDKLELAGAENGAFDVNFNKYELSNGKVNLLWDKSNGNVTGDGVLATLKFNVKSGATGTADVSLRFVEANNWDLASLQMTAAGGVVTIGGGSGSGSGNGSGGGSGSGSGGSSTATNSITLPASTENAQVSASATSAKQGDKVTVTVTPASGYTATGLRVLDANGNNVAVTSESGGKFSFTMPATAVSVEPIVSRTGGGASVVAACLRDKSCPISVFTDASPTGWYHDGVHWALSRGVMNGVSLKRFAPNDPTTRGMIVTMLYRMEGSPTGSAAAAFSDVSAGKWYTDAIAWAAANGIVVGYNEKTFGPMDNVTREQLATILNRYAQYKKLDVSVSAGSTLSLFSDANKASDWAIGSLVWANSAQIITGKGRELLLAPKDNATRAEVATMLMRFCEKYGV